MNNVGLSQASSKFLTNVPKQTEQNTVKEKPAAAKEDGNKKIKLALIALGLTAAAGIVAGAAIKGKSTKLNNIEFDKGFAKLKGATEGFSGKIKDSLPNGDKIVLEYKDGILQKSSRKGAKTVEKIFETRGEEHFVKITSGGKTSEVNLTALKNAVKSSKDDVKKILENSDALSLEDFEKQTGAIRYKSKAQQTEIDKIIELKTEALEKQRAFERVNKQIGDITFDKGVASFNGLPYKGKIYTTLKNGDKVVIETDALGRIVKSERTGSRNFVKEYDNFFSSVKITEDGKTKKVNIAEQIQKALKENKRRTIDLGEHITLTPTKNITKTLNGELEASAAKTGTSNDDLLKFLESYKDVVPDDIAKDFGNYTDKVYDIPDKFMLAVNNRIRKTGSGLIVDDVPKMFEGIKTQDLADTIDKIPFLLKSDDKIVNFTLGGKEFSMKFIDSGQIGKVYKIYDKDGNACAVKYFRDATLTGLQGIYAEMPIARQASLEGVKNVPKFYMANADIKYMNSYEPFGGWQMVEFIDDKKPLKEGGVGFFEWLKSKGLAFGDCNDGMNVGDYCVDLGGVMKAGGEKANLVFDRNTSFYMRSGMLDGENVLTWINTLKKGAAAKS